MNANRNSTARSSLRDTCERISKRLEELAKREGWYSNSEKIALLRKVYFADVDAAEKSGELKLPDCERPRRERICHRTN